MSVTAWGERLSEIELIPFDPDALELGPTGTGIADPGPEPAGTARTVTLRLSTVVACGAAVPLVAALIGWQVGHGSRHDRVDPGAATVEPAGTGRPVTGRPAAGPDGG
jgi:hypothetical protein